MSTIESIAVIAGDDHNDEVWISVLRTINGASVRCIEKFKPRFQVGDDQDSAWFVDCGNDSATGNSHLEGETVNILADGVKQPQQTVSSGAVDTTNFADATTVTVGLPVTYKIQPMKLNYADLAFITTRNIVRIILSLYRSLGGQFGPDASNLDDIPYTATTYDTGPALHTGTVELPFKGTYDNSGDLLIQGSDPLPMTVRAIGVKASVESD